MLCLLLLQSHSGGNSCEDNQRMLRLSVGVNVNNLYILPYLASLPLYYFIFFNGDGNLSLCPFTPLLCCRGIAGINAEQAVNIVCSPSHALSQV